VLPLLGLEPIGGDPVMCCDARPMAIFSVAHWLVPIILLGFQRHVKNVPVVARNSVAAGI